MCLFISVVFFLRFLFVTLTYLHPLHSSLLYSLNRKKEKQKKRHFLFKSSCSPAAFTSSLIITLVTLPLLLIPSTPCRLNHPPTPSPPGPPTTPVYHARVLPNGPWSPARIGSGSPGVGRGWLGAPPSLSWHPLEIREPFYQLHSSFDI